MKIMFLVPSFENSSPINGAFLFAKYLHDHDYDVSFVSLNVENKIKNSIIEKIKHSGLRFQCLGINNWPSFLLHKSRVQNYVSKMDIDIVLAYMLRPNLITSSLKNVVKIAFVRGMLSIVYSLTYNKLFASIAILLELRALRKMDQIFSLNRPITEWLVSEGIKYNRVSTQNNFVDLESIRSSVTDDNSLDKKNINVGIFCKLILGKRVDVVLNAFANLIYAYNHNNLKLHIAGDGKLRNHLENLAIELKINDKVIFHGFLENPLNLMNSLDIVLLTSESEGLPRCLMEALSLGKTVISSDLPGIEELIIEKETGYLFPSGDFMGLALLIDQIIQNKSFLPPEQLISYIRENYDINVCSEKMLDQIKNIYH